MMLGGSSPVVEVECFQGGRFCPPAGWYTAVCWAAGIDLLTCSAAAAGGAAGCLPEPGPGCSVVLPLPLVDVEGCSTRAGVFIACG